MQSVSTCEVCNKVSDGPPAFRLECWTKDYTHSQYLCEEHGRKVMKYIVALVKENMKHGKETSVPGEEEGMEESSSESQPRDSSEED